MLARGPNTLNLASYTQQEGQQFVYDPNQMVNQIQNQGTNLEQQFDDYVKDIQRYDEILAKVAKNITDVSAEQYFITDFYPEYALNCTYETDRQKKILANNDVQLVKVLQNLQRSNRNLKQQVKGWLFQYAKKTRLSQVLLSQNKLLRKYVSAKNKDIVKLIEAITNADNCQLDQLNQNLNQLKEQNGVLVDHLKDIRQALVGKVDEEKKIVEAYHRAEKYKIQIEGKIKAGEDQEEHYSKMVSLLEASIDDASKREKKLIEQKQRLKKIKKDYEADHEQIQKQIDECQMDRQDIDKQLKSKFKDHQSQKQKLMNQIEELTQKIQRTKQETRNVQQQINRHEFRTQQFTNLCNDLDKKISELNENLKKSEEQQKKLKQVQLQQLTAIDMINFDISVLTQELQQLSKLEQEKKQKYKKQIKEYEIEKKAQIDRAQQELSKSQWKISKALIQEKADLALKKKQIQEWENKIAAKKSQIDDLKQQLIEIKENQILAANLKNKLREVQKK